MIFSLNQNTNNLILILGFLINDVNLINTEPDKLNWDALIPFVLGNSKIKLYNYIENGTLKEISKYALNFEDDGYDKKLMHDKCKLISKKILNLLKISPDWIMEISLILGSYMFNPENPDFIIKLKNGKSYEFAIDLDINNRLFWKWLNLEIKDWNEQEEKLNKIINYWIFLSLNYMKPDMRNDILKIIKNNGITNIENINWNNYYTIKSHDYFGIPINKEVKFNQFYLNKILYLNAIYNPNSYFNYNEFINNWKSLSKNYIFEEIILDKLKEGFYNTNLNENIIFGDKVYYISDTWCGNLKSFFKLLNSENKEINFKYNNDNIIIVVSLNNKLNIEFTINPLKFIFLNKIIKYKNIKISRL